MTEPAITPELVQKHNLTPEEYVKLKATLGREPSYTELGIFSVMWSEHCSYKNTRPLLKTFPTKSPKILVGAGEENAGIIDIGDGLAIAFKIESHNHPSAVEPFQGAATGVGGIIRDIFTMGARPVCSINSLRFGPITEDGPVPDGPEAGTGHASRITHHASPPPRLHPDRTARRHQHHRHSGRPALARPQPGQDKGASEKGANGGRRPRQRHPYLRGRLQQVSRLRCRNERGRGGPGGVGGT
jgi:hypothetical protein